MVKIILLMLLFACASAQKCWNRQQLIEIRRTVNEVTCEETPRNTLVPLPVPKGYDWVYPKVIDVPRCGGLACMRTDQECVAVETRNKTITVKAYVMNSIMQHECKDVTVTEDIRCGCRCEKSQADCGMYEIFNKNFCRCECKPGLEKTCRDKMEARPGMFMWDKRSCTCPCNNQGTDCGDGNVFDQAHCRCVHTA